MSLLRNRNMNKIKNMILKRILLWRKQAVYFEVSSDIKFFEKFKQRELTFDDKKGRRELAEELKKPEEKRDVAKLKELSNLIADSASTLKNYENSLKVIKELDKYIPMLKS